LIASLPMYERRETAETLDALWAGVHLRLPFNAPDWLTREGCLWDHWGNPNLVLSQTCGLPYRARLIGKMQLVASPDNRLSGCPAGHYNSVFVVRRDDPRSDLAAFADAPLAYNEPLSQSGWAAPYNHAAGLGFAFSNPVYTGAHVNSARTLAEGRVDIACIDAVSWRLIQRHDAHASTLRELGRTAPTPAPPFITAQGRDVAAIAAALCGAIDALTPEARDIIGLYGLVQIPNAQYLAIPNPPEPGAPRQNG